MATARLDFAAIALSAREAFALLAAYPLRWLATVIVFLLAVESWILVPYAGFFVKLYVASVLNAQALRLFAVADSGRPPRVRMLLGAFLLPGPTQLVLAACTYFAFVVGLSYLVLQGGVGSLTPFLGKVPGHEPTSPEAHHVFKTLMYLAGLPFTFVGAALVLRNQPAWVGFTQGFAATVRNWRAVLVLLILSLSYEWGLTKLASHLPPVTALVFTIPLVMAFSAWSFAFTYTLSVNIYGLKSAVSRE